jgi:hypothetical protein
MQPNIRLKRLAVFDGLTSDRNHDICVLKNNAENDRKVQEEGCLALCRLAMLEENAVKIVAEGGIGAILTAMAQHVSDKGVQVMCMYVCIHA